MPYKIFKLRKLVNWGNGNFVFNPATVIQIDSITHKTTSTLKHDFIVAYFDTSNADFVSKDMYFSDAPTDTVFHTSAKIYFGISTEELVLPENNFNTPVNPADDVNAYNIYKSSKETDKNTYMDFVSNPAKVQIIAIKPAMLLSSLHDGGFYVKAGSTINGVLNETAFGTDGKILTSSLAQTGDMAFVSSGLTGNSVIAQALDLNHIGGANNIFLYAWAVVSTIKIESVPDTTIPSIS